MDAPTQSPLIAGSGPPTAASLRVLRRVMRREDALEWLVDLCGLTLTAAAELMDATSYPAPHDARGGSAVRPGKVLPMTGRLNP